MADRGRFPQLSAYAGARKERNRNSRHIRHAVANVTGLPAWVADKIAITTGLDPRLGRTAHTGVCPGCRVGVLRGLDADRCAFIATADPLRLTALGEVLALAGGRETYDFDGRPPRLTYRDRHQIRRRSADIAFVVPGHQCHAPELPNRPPDPHPRIVAKGGGHEPPF